MLLPDKSSKQSPTKRAKADPKAKAKAQAKADARAKSEGKVPSAPKPGDQPQKPPKFPGQLFRRFRQLFRIPFIDSALKFANV